MTGTRISYMVIHSYVVNNEGFLVKIKIVYFCNAVDMTIPRRGLVGKRIHKKRNRIRENNHCEKTDGANCSLRGSNGIAEEGE